MSSTRHNRTSILLKVLCLLENLFVDLVAVNRRIVIFSEQDDKVHF